MLVVVVSKWNQVSTRQRHGSFISVSTLSLFFIKETLRSDIVAKTFCITDQR